MHLVANGRTRDMAVKGGERFGSMAAVPKENDITD